MARAAVIRRARQRRFEKVRRRLNAQIGVGDEQLAPGECSCPGCGLREGDPCPCGCGAVMMLVGDEMVPVDV